MSKWIIASVAAAALGLSGVAQAAVKASTRNGAAAGAVGGAVVAGPVGLVVGGVGGAIVGHHARSHHSARSHGSYCRAHPKAKGCRGRR